MENQGLTRKAVSTVTDLLKSEDAASRFADALKEFEKSEDCQVQSQIGVVNVAEMTDDALVNYYNSAVVAKLSYDLVEVSLDEVSIPDDVDIGGSIANTVEKVAEVADEIATGAINSVLDIGDDVMDIALKPVDLVVDGASEGIANLTNGAGGKILLIGGLAAAAIAAIVVLPKIMGSKEA